MEGINFETLMQVVTILGGTIGLFLVLLQIIETYVDIGDKLHRRQLDRKNQAFTQARDHNSQSFTRKDLGQGHKSSPPE